MKARVLFVADFRLEAISTNYEQLSPRKSLMTVTCSERKTHLWEVS